MVRTQPDSNRPAIYSCLTILLLTLLGQTTAEASHPIIPGFERFFREKPDAEGGRLLIGELNCTSCHVSSTELVEAAWVTPKQAPRLNDVGSRVTPDFLRRYLANPQEVKPGATMPDVLSHLPDAERDAAIENLVHLLASTGRPSPSAPATDAVKKGEELFHSVGCVACHNSRRDGAAQLTSSVPLGKPELKYTIASLSNFLGDPHSVRPSGRMPSLNLTSDEATQIASYLLQDVDVTPNINYQVFEGNWERLPDFSALKAVGKGQATGLDLGVAERRNNFGIRFEGYLQIAADAEYTLWLGGDDGVRMLIDGKTVIDVDGIHPYSEKQAKVSLTKGAHSVTVDYFQGGGEWVLRAGIAGPGFNRTDLASMMTPEETDRREDSTFVVNEAKVAEGKKLFTSIGCARCHQLPFTNNSLQEYRAIPHLTKVESTKGCLAEQPGAGVPDYSLDAVQRQSIIAAIQQLDELDGRRPDQRESIRHTMQTSNCYACHSRDGRGGVEQERNPWFVGTIQEMGDEGRIPPLLDGAGDKLTDAWLKEVMEKGAKDRPYMMARMPKFGTSNVGTVIQSLIERDRKPDTIQVKLSEAPHRVKSSGRYMVGDQALSCVKCHNFAGEKGTGIQSVDLTTMTKRLRRDWFIRYMINPQVYRPGTRMPSAWPNGFSILPKVLEGDTNQQLAAIWLYLDDGSKARRPSGIGRKAIELTPEDRPILYRNFIEGLGPRGIAVGYPEKAHLAFDAERMSLTLIWHGAFMDAGRHWVGRGQGNQGPLGDHLFSLGNEVPIAELKTLETKWPEGRGRDADMKFLGYQLDDDGRPVFRYRFKDLTVEDHPVPVEGRLDFGFRRTLDFKGSVGADPVWFRAATADKIEAQADGWFLVDNAVRIRLTGTAPIVRWTGGKMQLLAPIQPRNEQLQIVQEIDW